MRRDDFAPELRAALDMFAAPDPREDFAERIVECAVCPKPRPAPRDRRGGWTLARRAVIGTLAAGMVSAAAVASGLLGTAGIRVPVLTAMLAPARKPTAAPHKSAARVAVVAKPRATLPKAEDPGLTDPGSIAPSIAPSPIPSAVLARRAERQAFIASHPELRPVIRQVVAGERQFVRDNPEVRELRRLPFVERRAFLSERPELRAAVRARRAERRALIEAHPDVAALLRARAEQRRNWGNSSAVAPAAEGNGDVPR